MPAVGDHHYPKTQVIVAIVGMVVVAVGAAHVPGIIVERTAAHHPVTIDPAPCRGMARQYAPRVYAPVTFIQPPSSLPISVII
jgi:hypothetical protein